MGVVEDLYQRGVALGSGNRVTDVRIGLGYTAVEVEDGSVGLAYTFRSEAGHTCTAMKLAGELSGQPVENLLTFMKEKDVVSSAIGFATFNALIQAHSPPSLGEDFFPFIRLKEGERVGMVGFFAPIIPMIRKAGCELFVFEKNLKRGEGLSPPGDIPSQLPSCSVVILSATTLINHTFEGIVPFIKEAREVVLLGPSTPMVPDILETWGVTLLAGMKTIKPQKVLQIVSEGGGTQRLKGTVKKMVVSCRK